MRSFPQAGGCVCGEIRYVLRDDPVTVYACHCTDCQTETGSAFYLSVVVPAAAFEYTRGTPERWDVVLPDGREKGSFCCARCKTNLGGPGSLENLASVDGGTFDDTSWLVPAGHIWTRSAQSWIQLPEDSLRFETAPGQEGFVSMARKWKSSAP
ncbi:MAG: GFA family protein [Deltaproteobacteria bacterium]|nr:GFA family protein [Deltaproteobacteria bacterium]MBW2414820.1 GFA family protein [Deltaproteobacteria bacterium]